MGSKSGKYHVSRWFRPFWLGLGCILGGRLLVGCETSSTTPETDPNAEIIILSPVGGERFVIGDTLRVKWKVQGKGLAEVNAVNIDLSPDSGKTWVGLRSKSIAVFDSTWGSFPWPIPSEIMRLGVTYSLANNTRLRLKIMQYSTADTNKIAVTRKTFSIVPR